MRCAISAACRGPRIWSATRITGCGRSAAPRSLHQGRLFTGGETGVASPPPVVVISYELWQSAFGAQPIVSHGVDVDGRRLQVVGVMARGADLMDNHTEIWLPLGFTGDERRARNNH